MSEKAQDKAVKDALAVAPDWEAEGLESTVTPENPYVGDEILWTVKYVRPADVAIHPPKKPDLGAFELLGMGHQEKSAGEGRVQDIWTLRLSTYQLEDAELKGITFEVVTPEGPQALRIPGRTLTLRSLVTEEGEGEPRELAPPEAVMIPDYTPLHIAAGLMALVVLFFLGRWAWRRHQARPKVEKPVPAAPPKPVELRAREALDALAQEGLVARGEHKLFYFRLSEILRDYLGARFGFHALESTTDELLEALRDRRTPGLDHGRFEQWCRDGDLVKFARQVPTDAESSQALTDAYAFVEDTTAAAQRPASEEAA